jgi:hypothetical protein
MVAWPRLGAEGAKKLLRWQDVVVAAVEPA